MQNALTFLMKKKSFAPLTNNFDPLKLGSKVIYQRGKTSVFHQKSEGVLHSLFAGI